MGRRFAISLLPLCFFVVGCDNGAADPISAFTPTPAARLVIPADGEPTYYSSEVNATYYGGYDGYDNPDAARTAVYTEELTWSSGTGFWDIRDTFSPQYGPFGAEDLAEPGVSQVLRTRNDISSYDRAGQLISQPDTTLALSSQVSGSPSLSRVPMDFGRSSATQIPGASGSVAAPPFSGQAGVDRHLVTPAAARRTFNELMRTAKKTGVNGSLVTFEIARGEMRVNLRFDSAIGAVTRIVATSPDGATSDIEYSYTEIPGAFVLTQELTVIRTPGDEPIRILRRYSNQQTR